jgi:hypothetical protein
VTTTLGELQPVAVTVYDIVDVPTVTPLTMPEEEPMVATEMLLLAHVLPGVGEFNVVVPPTQSKGFPVIAPGIGLMETVIVALQPMPGAV